MPGIRMVLLAAAVAVPASAAAKGKPAASTVTFEQQVRPILKAHCFQCHGEGGKKEGGLDMRLRRFLVKGGESGPAIVPGNIRKSYLVARIRAGEMPPGKKQKLTRKELKAVERWIAAGAKTASPEPATVGDGPLITDEERNFWAFQAVKKPVVPLVRNRERVRNPIDAFLLRKLESRGLSFSERADRRTLIRRATFDLHGLPPTPDEIARFLADRRPDAWERLIDRLLASPRYGERWGRRWLDVAGYADSEGYVTADTERPWAYKYRDYVVRSFNANKPFDRFVLEQLAGDELVGPTYRNLKPGDVEKLVATGFLRMAPDGTGNGGVDQTEARNQVVADTLHIVGSSLLGLTVNCAQCHDHRYDPIPQTDYYRLRAIFEPAYDPAHWRSPAARRLSLYTDADRKEAARIEAAAAKIDKERLKKQADYIERTFRKELAKLPAEIRDEVGKARNTPVRKRTAAQQALLRKHPSVNVTAGSLYLYDRKAADDLKAVAARAAKLRGTKPKEEFLRVLTEVPGKVPATRLFFRGDPKQPKQNLTPASLSILQHGAAIPVNDKSRPTTGRRLAFARSLIDGRHPLFARVIVNRVWQQHFGKGIVDTPSDFGRLGERPTHPELLDWLAAEFEGRIANPSVRRAVEAKKIDGLAIRPTSSRWDLKRMHRLIMTSAAYRQVSTRRSELDAVDPDNRLLGRMAIRRLDAEGLRDSLLAVCGRLNPKMFGPPVPVMEDNVGRFVIGKENKNGEGRNAAVIPLHGEEFRRSVYVQSRRSRPLAVLSTFDAPRMEPNCERRNSSTVTPQSLLLMNDDIVIARCRDFAARLQRDCGPDPSKQAARAWELALGVPPTAGQLKDSLAFLRAQRRQLATRNTGKQKFNPAQLALASLCQALVSSNGFLYVD
jgi:mono/diheme cytochrome c family protein